MFSSFLVFRRALVREIQEMIENLEDETGGQLKIITYEDRDNSLSLDFRLSPLEGPYAHAVYNFMMVFDNSRPTHIPQIYSSTYIHHPNISASDGHVEICLNLFDEWQTSMGIKCLLHGLLFLFCEPNFDDALNDDFIVPDEMTGEEVIQTALMGGSVFGATHEANPDWLVWRQWSDLDGTHIDTYPTPLVTASLQTDSDPYSSSYRRFVSSDALKCLHAFTHDTSVYKFNTIELHEIAVVWHRSLATMEVNFYHAENCSSVDALATWREAHYGQLNPRPVQLSISEICQQAFHQPWISELPASYCNALSVRPQCKENELNRTTSIQDIGIPRYSIADNQIRTFLQDSSVLNRLTGHKWFFHQTRWPVYFCPGLPLTKHLLKLQWPQAPWLASTGSLFRELQIYLNGKSWSPYSTLLLIDSLALSPWSPAIVRLVFEPDVSNMDESDSSKSSDASHTNVYEWLSPWYSTVLSVRSFSERHRLPFRRILPWIALAVNWLAFLSRMELHHCYLGYSRPGYTIFSHFRRVTDPVGVSHLHPMSLVCGQTGWLDGWPLWLAACLGRGILHSMVKLAQLMNRHYYANIKLSQLSDCTYSKRATICARFLFTEVDYFI